MIYFMLFLIFVIEVILLCLCISILKTDDDIVSFLIEIYDKKKGRK